MSGSQLRKVWRDWPVCWSSVVALAYACGHASPSDVGADAGDDAGSTTDTSVVVDGGRDAGAANGDGGGTVDGGCPYAYCEDFLEEFPVAPLTDQELLGPWRVSNRGPPGQLADIDEVNPKTGKKSLHVTVAASTQGDVSLSQGNGFGLVPGNDLYGRLEIFYSNVGTYGVPDAGIEAGIFGMPFNSHTWVFTASGYNAEGGTEGINLQYGTAHVGQTPVVELAFTDSIAIAGGAVTAGAWHCLQWQLDGSNPSDVANVWLDGTNIASGDAGEGVEFSHALEPVHAWVHAPPDTPEPR